MAGTSPVLVYPIPYNSTNSYRNATLSISISLKFTAKRIRSSSMFFSKFVEVQLSNIKGSFIAKH